MYIRFRKTLVTFFISDLWDLSLEIPGRWWMERVGLHGSGRCEGSWPGPRDNCLRGVWHCVSGWVRDQQRGAGPGVSEVAGWWLAWVVD